MNDMTETSAPSVDNIRAGNKNLVVATLAAASIRKVSIEFDGSGDSGQIEDILAWNAAGDTIPLPSSPKLQLTSPVTANPPLEITLQEAVETLAYDCLEDTHPGWEINDGAFGTFVFDVLDRSITLDYRECFTDVDISTRQF